MTRRRILQLGMASGPAASVLAGVLDGASAQAQPAAGAVAASSAKAADGIEKAFVCFRIGAPLWLNEARFGELLDLFERHRGVTDEITLFTSETHPPLPLAVIQERAPILKARMAAARNRGYHSGINVLSTLGHLDENLPNSLSAQVFTPMMDASGRVCGGSFCPNSEHLRAYVAQVYEAMAKAGPDYIWIDDDVRLWGHGPVSAACFCDTCVQRFSAKAGRSFTRESLCEALSVGPRADKLRLRREFLQHNRDTVSELFRLIEKTVRSVAPSLPLGFMTGDRFYEGYDFDTWAEVLAGPQRAPVLWRPGGGAYRDERLIDFTDKAHDIGRQTALLPPWVRCIESEVENFPYQRLKKSVHATALEAAVYIASGCTGTAFNVMSMYDEPLDAYEPLVAGLGAARPFLDLLARAQGRAPCVGIHAGWVKDSYAAQNPDGPWFGGPATPSQCNEIWATGLPAAYSAAQACVTAWSGDQVLAFTKDEIGAALAHGVYLDGPALTRLNELGYGELTGFTISETRDVDCIEQLTDHPLNGAFAGRRRDGRQSFWKCPTHCFRHTADGAQTLARVIDYTSRETWPCCLGVFENPRGGRVCVAGYYPWDQLQTQSKSSQMKAIMRWLSKDTLPAYVGSYHRVNLWVRRLNEQALAIAYLNSSLDPARDIEMLVHTESSAVLVTDMRGAETQVKSSGADGPYRRFVLPNVAPWEMALAVV
ncbi:MAG: hypothetical protein HZB26_13865 [Candidatus Hydrogenedentes bacterium]|nr:hypothetical protein [Candidatus Hydrogenedentota bacterium]